MSSIMQAAEEIYNDLKSGKLEKLDWDILVVECRKRGITDPRDQERVLRRILVVPKGELQ